MSARTKLGYLQAWAPVIVVSVIILWGVLARLTYLNPNHFNHDVWRNYLVSKHIVSFHEFPELGPNNSVFGSVTLPLVYWATAVILLVYDSVFFLHIFNVLTQVGIIIIVYFISSKLFSRYTATLATLMLVFAHLTFRQSAFFFEPYMAQFLLLLGIFFLYLSFKKNSFSWLIVANIIYGLSIWWHSSMFGVCILWLAGTVYILKNMYLEKRQFLKRGTVAFGCLFLVLLFGYSPLLYQSMRHDNMGVSLNTGRELANHFIQHNVLFFSSIIPFSDRLALDMEAHDEFVLSSNYYPSGLIDTFLSSAHNLIFDPAALFASRLQVAFLIFILLFVCIEYYFLNKNVSKSRKELLISIIFAILSSLFLLSLFRTYKYSVHFYAPIAILAFVGLAEILSVSLGSVWFKRMCVGFFLLFFVQFIAFQPTKFVLSIQELQDVGRGSVRGSGKVAIPIITNIAKRVEQIRVEEAKGNLLFFDIEELFVNQDGEAGFNSPAYVWSGLEQHFNTRLVKINTATWNGLESIGDGEYIFLLCPQSVDREYCTDSFRRKFIQYTIEEVVSWDGQYVIFLAKNLEN